MAVPQRSLILFMIQDKTIRNKDYLQHDLVLLPIVDERNFFSGRSGSGGLCKNSRIYLRFSFPTLLASWWPTSDGLQAHKMSRPPKKTEEDRPVLFMCTGLESFFKR